MYKGRDDFDGTGGGLLADAPAPARAGWRARVERRFHRLDIAHDLAEEIGSARWYRGFAAVVSLSAVALSFWPDFSPVEAATSVPADVAVRDEYRSQMIGARIAGSDSGRRMAATDLVVPLAHAPERPRIELVATLAPGDSFGRMLQRAGVGADDAARVSELVAAAVPLGEVAPGTRFAMTLGPRNAEAGQRPVEKLRFRARFDLDLAVDRRGGALVLARRAIAVDTTPLRIRGTVGASLYRSARAAGAPAVAIQQYLQALDSHLSLEGDIAPDDTFDIVVGFKRSAGGASETGQLLYAGLERSGKPLAQLLRWGGDGQFFDASGVGQASASALYAPVAGRMTSGYGMRRHPILGYARMHAGIDFGAAWGSPIHAVSGGVVSYAGRHGGHGNYVRLEHGGGLGTGYAHMSRIAVAPGMQVRPGQVIGYVGSTGLSTGPHLHYELYQNGRTVDPLSVRFAIKAAAVDGKELAAFKARIAQLKTIAPGAALKKLAAGKAPAAWKPIGD